MVAALFILMIGLERAWVWMETKYIIKLITYPGKDIKLEIAPKLLARGQIGTNAKNFCEQSC